MGDDRFEAVVGCDFPANFDVPLRHPAAVLDRLWGETRPKHEAVRRRIAAGDAELERVVLGDRTASGKGGRRRSEHRPSCRDAADLQKRSTIPRTTFDVET